MLSLYLEKFHIQEAVWLNADVHFYKRFQY